MSDIFSVIVDEVQEISKMMRGNKAPDGSDQIPNVAIKAAFNENPNLLSQCMQYACLDGTSCSVIVSSNLSVKYDRNGLRAFN